MSRLRSPSEYWLGAAFVLAAGLSIAVGESVDKTRATMDRIFEPLGRALVVSLDEARFVAPESRRPVLDDLRSLSRAAADLERHGAGQGPGLDFLRQTLAHDAREAALDYERGEYESARFALQQATESCFACHSKLPAAGSFELGRRLLANASVKSLPPEQRVKLEVTARQFETAMETYEEILRSPTVGTAEVYFMGAFEGYLKICVRVRHDLQRPLAALAQFRTRPGLPRYLAEYVGGWMAALRQLQGDMRPGDELARARTLLGEAQARQRFEAGRDGLVHAVVASALLTQLVESNPQPGADLAEAYYLLGVAESEISRLSWVSEVEYYLESAIRAAPSSPAARNAYLFLEEYVLNAYTGSSGLDMPGDVERRLETLRKLVDRP